MKSSEVYKHQLLPLDPSNTCLGNQGQATFGLLMIDLGQERLKLLLAPIRAFQRLLLLIDHV